jgi:hypothetical protein
MVLVFCFSAGCRVNAVQAGAGQAPLNPQDELVLLDAAQGWEARLLWTSDGGVWTVALLDVIEQCAGPEVVALDDRGRCALLGFYASKVSLWQPVMDGLWLGGVAHDDLDSKAPGAELYVGGKRGNLYQVVPLPQGGFNSRVIAYFPGKEIHTLVSADMTLAVPGNELYAALLTGELYLLDPSSRAENGEWKAVLVHKDPGRIRDAVVFESDKDAEDTIVYASRSGRVVLLEPRPQGFLEEVLYTCPQGLARIDQATGSDGSRILYVAGDDGQVMRFEDREGRPWSRELIYAGPAGARGVAAGRFDEDPGKESIAIFGYSGNVEILRKEPTGKWFAETIFTDVDKGHWLSAGELDDRNGTDEIVISGYGRRVVMLSRPSGYGL